MAKPGRLGNMGSTENSSDPRESRCAKPVVRGAISRWKLMSLRIANGNWREIGEARKAVNDVEPAHCYVGARAELCSAQVQATYAAHARRADAAANWTSRLRA